ncbi:MAG: Rpn family recombination-promoting nuclease/putative transposase [Myxococcales bacterium]
MKLQRPHDEFFKALLAEPGMAGAFLRERLPVEVVETFAEGEPQLVPESFVLPELQEHQADRLFRVQRKDGSAAYVYCPH